MSSSSFWNVIESAIVCFSGSGGETHKVKRMRSCCCCCFVCFFLNFWSQLFLCIGKRKTIGWEGGNVNDVLDVIAGWPFISCVKQLGLPSSSNLLVGKWLGNITSWGSFLLTLRQYWFSSGAEPRRKRRKGKIYITKPNEKKKQRMWLNVYRHHSDGVYTIIHQERRTRKEFRWYFLLFCFNVTGGKRMRERHDGHLNDGHPRVYVCAAVLCRIGLYNVWLCYWVFFFGSS